MEFPEICKSNFKGRIPAEAGTRFQSVVVWKHHKSSLHKACLEARTKQELYKAKSTDHPMISAANKANEQLSAQITTHMLDVYNDAKRVLGRGLVDF